MTMPEPLSFSLPPNAVVPKMNFALPTTVGLHEITFEQLAFAIMNGRIVGYSNNRGLKRAKGKQVLKTSKETVKSVRNNFKPSSFGQISVTSLPDGRLMASDCHSRSTGIVYRYVDGNLTPGESNAKCSLQIVPPDQFLEDYKIRNTVHRHSTGNKISNPDLLYGDLISKIFALLTPNAREFYQHGLGKKLNNFTAYLIFYQHENPDRKTWEDYVSVALCKNHANKLANELPGHIVLTDMDIKDIASACEAYYDLFILTRNRANGMDVNKLFTASGWFGTFVVDQLTGEKNFPAIDKSAIKVFQNYHDLLANCPSTDGTNERVMRNKLKKVWVIMSKQIKKAS